jgi:hypothetical protein
VRPFYSARQFDGFLRRSHFSPAVLESYALFRFRALTPASESDAMRANARVRGRAESFLLFACWHRRTEMRINPTVGSLYVSFTLLTLDFNFKMVLEVGKEQGAVGCRGCLQGWIAPRCWVASYPIVFTGAIQGPGAPCFSCTATPLGSQAF